MFDYNNDVIYLGDGDVSIGIGGVYNSNRQIVGGYLSFKNLKYKQDIGTCPDENAVEYDEEFRIYIHNLDSLDVLMERLEDLKIFIKSEQERKIV